MANRKNQLTVALISATLAFAVTLPALAVSENARGISELDQSSSTEFAPSPNQRDKNTPTTQGSSGKLEDAKKRICEKSEARIQNTIQNVRQLGEGQWNLFTTIQDRIETYSADNGVSVANYEELQAKVDAARGDAESAMVTMTHTSSQFGCDKEDPKGVANQFKVQVKTQVEKLKAYRVALKELLTAVKTAAVKAETTEEAN